MEAETFLQCLSYIATTGSSKTIVEQYIAPISALVGATVGFSINKIADLIKSRSEKNDKRRTIMDDVVRIRELAATSIGVALEMWDMGAKGKMPNLYELPHKINSYCIDEYFVPLSHTYSRNECDAMFKAIEKLQFLNIMLSKCYDDTPNNIRDLKALSHNVIKMAAAIYALADNFINDTPMASERNVLEVIDFLGFPDSDFVQKLRLSTTREVRAMDT